MYLGIDLGTSSLKTVVINDNHEQCASAESSLTVNSPHRNWSEQNPEDWITALHDNIEQLSRLIDLKNIQRIGLSGQMHGATLLDKNHRVLRPCILWNDGRSSAQCDQLMSFEDEFLNASGNLAMPGFTAPKLMWIKEHEPDVFKRIHKVLLPKDYLRFYLTGEFMTDPSDASGTLWLNPTTRQWDEYLLNISGMKLEHMPEIYEGPEETGKLLPQRAASLGMNQVSIVAGGGDNACGALGMGVAHDKQSFISLGTSGVFFYVSDEATFCPEKTVHSFAHALPQTWHQMTVTLSAASSLSWLASVVNSEVNTLLENLSASNKTETDVIFLPYLNGERSPHNDPNARGMFMNLSHNTSHLDLCLAVLEGVAFSFNDGLDALKVTGADIESTFAIGGGSKSRFWLQMLANSLQINVDPLSGASLGASLGAARLAMFDQTNAYPIPQSTGALIPNQLKADYYESKLADYRDLYKVCKPLFKS